MRNNRNFQNRKKQQCYVTKLKINGAKRIEIREANINFCPVEVCKELLPLHAFPNTLH